MKLLISAVALMLTGCAATVEPAPELRVRHFYAPMQYHGVAAQQRKPDSQPTGVAPQPIYNSQGRALGYIR